MGITCIFILLNDRAQWTWHSPLGLNQQTPIGLAQRTAELDGGHDAIVKNDATIVIDIALGNSSRHLPTINMVWLTPTRCADLF